MKNLFSVNYSTSKPSRASTAFLLTGTSELFTIGITETVQEEPSVKAEKKEELEEAKPIENETVPTSP